nr:MAG TPA: hypothetical protein [Caudoviricetes sp.]
MPSACKESAFPSPFMMTAPEFCGVASVIPNNELIFVMVVINALELPVPSGVIVKGMNRTLFA